MAPKHISRWTCIYCRKGRKCGIHSMMDYRGGD